MKRRFGWHRDPEGMRKRILDAATEEFARYGYGGARIDRIAKAAGANKRMIYYHVGKKDVLYLAILESVYEHIRAAERHLDLPLLEPVEAITKLITFFCQYHFDYPQFIRILNNENMLCARFLKRSRKVTRVQSPYVSLIADVLRRGAAKGELRDDIDPMQLYISIAGLAYFYHSNSQTLSVIFGRNLLTPSARAKRLAHMIDLVLAALRPTSPNALDRTTRKHQDANRKAKR
jgi:AcrR family transcriptional regulator